MLTKVYSETGHQCRVTFTFKPPPNTRNVTLCGEFNNWDPTAYPMHRQEDGTFVLTIPLQPGRSYRFKYLVDGQWWENDWAADGYAPNEFGTDDSVVVVP